MKRKRTPQRRSIAVQTAELALAAPQVVAHRLARLAAAGARPSARDRREFTRMVVEKQGAAAASMASMMTQGWLSVPRIAASMMQAAWQPWSTRRAPQDIAQVLGESAERIVAAALQPVRRTAVSNARRLARSRRKI